jgi:hypothetical protein
MDSNNSAASSAIAYYTAAPTAGTLVGQMGAWKILLPATATLTYIAPNLDIAFGLAHAQVPTLRGTAQQLALTLSAAPATGLIDVTLEWTEETNSF